MKKYSRVSRHSKKIKDKKVTVRAYIRKNKIKENKITNNSGLIKMREIKSKCCNTDVDSDWYPGKKYHTAEDIKYRCLKCGKPCKTKEAPR